MGKRQRYRRADVECRLRGVEVFAPLCQEELAEIAGRGRLGRWKAGQVVFRAGDAAERVHLICEGSVEVLRPTPSHPHPTPVAILSAGELIGDMSLLTGTPRRSLGRVREDALLWTLEGKVFREVTARIPGYGMALAKVFAHRLEDSLARLRRQDPDEGMAGRLEQVDLPTVIQTLVSTRQSGVLAVADDRGKNVAQVLLVDGEIVRARCHDLEGEEAFYEVFLRDEPGEFLFRTKRVPDASAVSETPIDVPAMSLLMEAMRRIDEVRRFREVLPEAGTPLSAVGADAEGAGRAHGNGSGASELEEALLSRFQRPRPLREVIRDLPGSTYSLYDVAARLYEGGRLR